MATESVQLIFKIQAQNAALMNDLKQGIQGVTGAIQKHMELTNVMIIRQGEQIRQNNELIQSLKGVSSAHTGASQSTSESIVKGIVYSQILMQTAAAVKAVTIESTEYAARTQQLGVIMDQLARVNGLSVTAVRAQADAVKGLGITTQESREVINRMIFAQLDLAKATDLTRVSQNAAKIAGVSSSEALQGIINGIIEQRVQVLRTYGIQVQFESAMVRGAAALGKNKEALSDYERANIALNEVLSKGPRIIGTYEVSLSTAAGQMQSLKRHIDEAKNSLGEGFLPVMERVVTFLTGATKNVEENAEAYQKLALHISAAGLALTAAKLTPGGPITKAIVGIAVGAGVEAIGNVDPIQQQQQYSSEAITKIEEERRLLAKRLQNGEITDKADYIKQDGQLKDLQLQVERNFTDELARIYKHREDALVATPKSFGASRTFEDPKRPGRFDRSFALPSENLPYPTGNFSLGNGLTVTPGQIQTQIDTLFNPVQNIDVAGLQRGPNPAANVDAVIGLFTTKVKEALESSKVGVERANESLLTGPSKIEAERQTALEKLAFEFKQFNNAFNQASKDAGSVKDPKERQQLLDTIKAARSQYGTVVARTNQQFDIQGQVEQRGYAIQDIQRGKRLSDVDTQIQIEQERQKSTNAKRIARANRSETDDDKDINETFSDRVDLAKKERTDSGKQAAVDLAAAKAIYQLNKDAVALKEAEANNTIAVHKADAKLQQETSQAETDKEISLLALRKKQNTELKEAAALVREIAKSEDSYKIKNSKDDAERFVKVAQAQADNPGDIQHATNLGIQQRRQAAIQEYELAKQSREEQEQANREEYLKTNDKAALEKASADIRKQGLEADYNLEKAIADLRTDKEIQIAEIRKQQAEELVGLLGKFYDDIGVKGRGAAKFFQEQLDAFKKQLFVNTGSIVFKGALQQLGNIIPGQQEIDPATGKPTGQLTTIGKVLQSTPFGIDQAKLAQAQQVKAVDRNTKALEDLTDTLTGKPGSSAPGTSGAGGVGNNPGSWGGWGGNTNAGPGGIIGVLGGLLRSITHGIGGGGGTGTNNPMVIQNFGNMFIADNASGGPSSSPTGLNASNLVPFFGLLANIQGAQGGSNFAGHGFVQTTRGGTYVPNGNGSWTPAPGVSGAPNIDWPSGGGGGGGWPSGGGIPIPGWPGGGGGGAPTGWPGGGGGTASSNPMNVLNSLGGILAMIPKLSKNNPALAGAIQTASLRNVFQHVTALTGPGGIFGAKTNAAGQAVFSAGQTGLAAALALPQILGGFKEGGVGGDLTAIGGILGVGASIPSPIAPFLEAGSALLTLIGPMLGQSNYQKWQKQLNNRLASKFQGSTAINLTSDMAGNSSDFDYLGNIRSFSGGPGATNISPINVTVSTMDARSFMDNSSNIASAVQSQLQLGHPLLQTIQNVNPVS